MGAVKTSQVVPAGITGAKLTDAQGEEVLEMDTELETSEEVTATLVDGTSVAVDEKIDDSVADSTALEEEDEEPSQPQSGG